jgi:DNA-binding HxlR family transcriptional regulator
MRNEAIWETLVVEAAITRALPPAWSLQMRPSNGEDRGVDGIAELIGPNQQRVTFALEVKRSGPVSSTGLVDQLTTVAARAPEPLLFVTDYINPTLRAGLSDAGISFADGTGWVRIVRDEPLLLVSQQGASKAPKSRETSNITRLNGKAASRIIRALLECPVPLGVRELAELTDTSPGSVSKLLPTLAADGAVERDGGAVVKVRKRTLLDRWTQDYAFLNSNSLVLDYLAPRGLTPVLNALRQRSDVCVTGSGAARTYLPESTSSVLPLTQLTCFARDPQGLASDLQLVRTDRSTANVIVTRPADPQLLVNPSRTQDGLPVVPVSQALADLVTLPGRAAQEADQLIDVLAATDPAWRE